MSPLIGVALLVAGVAAALYAIRNWFNHGYLKQTRGTAAAVVAFALLFAGIVFLTDPRPIIPVAIAAGAVVGVLTLFAIALVQRLVAKPDTRQREGRERREALEQSERRALHRRFEQQLPELVGRLRSEDRDTRIDAIIALSAAVQTPEDERTACELLCACVRGWSRDAAEDRSRLQIQTAMLAIGRRRFGPPVPDSGSRLNLADADLRSVALSGADLRGVSLARANLCDALLDGVDLRDASLVKADLRGAVLRGAQLDGAWLDEARFDPDPTTWPEGVDPGSLGATPRCE